MKIKLPKAIKEKTLGFPFTFFRYDSDDDNFVVPFHYHQDQQVFRVLEGSVNISINAVNYKLKKGDCVLLAGESVHALYPIEKGTIFDSVSFNIRELFDLTLPHYALIKQLLIHQIEIKPFISGDKNTEITHIVDQLFDAVRAPARTSAALSVIGKVLDLISLVIEKEDTVFYDKDTVNRSYKYYLKSTVIFKYICDNYKREVTLEEMAVAVDFSEKYFCKFFKELTDLRPMEFLNMFRIEAAAIALAISTDSINEVAARCGFKDPCYFTKLFRRFKGASPRDFRESIPNKYYKTDSI